MAIKYRLYHAWNAFMNRDPTYEYANVNSVYTSNPVRTKFNRGAERTILNSIYLRLALDASSIVINHVINDENGRYKETVQSGLNRCLNLKANIDQPRSAFLLDIYTSLLDEGCIAIVPIDTVKYHDNGEVDIITLRVGKIIDWYPSDVRVRVYDDRDSIHKDIKLTKSKVAIKENPFYPIMNEPNSTMQRLIRKLNLLDAIDEQSGSNKLDLIVQLPYAIKSNLRKEQAEERRKDLENQLRGSKYGIAYTDGTEKITQLNRSVDNNLMNQIQYLYDTLYTQLGLTNDIMNGTADSGVMTNYYSRITEPLVAAVVDGLKCAFLSSDALVKRESIHYFRDPFKLVPLSELAELSDKFTRNEIMSSNEFRQVIGRTPSTDERADQLLNKNISHPAQDNEQEENQNG